MLKYLILALLVSGCAYTQSTQDMVQPDKFQLSTKIGTDGRANSFESVNVGFQWDLK